jgi:RND family efflux transporter MFP subunit
MSQAQGNAPTPVTLATVGGNPDSTTIAAPANVQPYLTQNIVARASGLLTDLSAYTGDRISAGQVVAHLDEPELRNNAQAAQAAAQAAQIEAVHHAPNGVLIARNDARAAQSDWAAAQADVVARAQQVSYWRNEIVRERELLSQGAVSQREYQDEVAQAAAARSAFRAAQEKAAATRAQVASAQTRMSDAQATVAIAHAQASQATAAAQAQNITAGYTSVIVPDEAVVTKRLVDPGVYVQAGTPILQVAVIDRLRVQAQVAQSDIARVRVGAPIDVQFEGDQTLHGTISSMSPVADPTTHTAIAEAIVTNPGSRMQPGGFVHVVIHAQGRNPDNTFSVPSASIVGGESSAVWISADGIAHRTPVSVISDDGTIAQVRGNGLQPGMRVVVAGAQSLEEGQQITGATQ